VPVKIRSQGDEPASPLLEDSYLIAQYAHSTATSLLAGFNSLRKGPGTTKHEEQDLLRAMLLLAGAGLDACAQQVVKDTLSTLVQGDEDARKELVAYATRVLRRASSGEGAVEGVDPATLASLLIGSPEVNLIDGLVEDLTKSSMQSVEELKRVSRHLGVAKSQPLLTAIQGCRGPLKVRNRIAHDMDVNITKGKSRNRRSRKREDMVKATNCLLVTADRLIEAVDQQLPSQATA
jgi:hypothetical protein